MEEEKRREKEEETDSKVMSTISPPLFSHCKHDGSACSKFGCLTPLHGSTLHRRVEDGMGAGCHTMVSQTISEFVDEIVGSELGSRM